MPRIAREELERLIGGQGHWLIAQGKDLACHCPWHAGDDTPSCIITPKTNLWHCFGCDAGGSVIDWVMRAHQVSFRHACELLARQHPALAAAASTSATAVPAPKLSAGKLRAAQSFSLAAGDQALLDQVIEFYHQTLKTSPEALQYLDSRGHGDGDTLRVLEAHGRGVRSWSKNIHLSSREKAADCSHRNDDRPDPGQFYIIIDNRVPFLFDDKVDVVRSEIVDDLKAKGYVIRDVPTHCNVALERTLNK